MTIDNASAEPEADLKEPETGEIPRSPKVIGIVSILYSIVFLLMKIVMLISLLVGLSAVMSDMKLSGLGGPLGYITTGSGLFCSLWLLFIGFSLFKYRDVGRRHLKFYIIFQAFSWVATTTIQYLQIPSYADVVEVLQYDVGLMVVFLAVMVWLLSILNKPHVRASLT